MARRTAGWVALAIAMIGLVVWGSHAERSDQRVDQRSLAATATADQPPPVQELLATTEDFRRNRDRIEVWVCEVPLDTADVTYQPSPLRVDLDPETLAEVIGGGLSEYFDELSHDQYLATVVPGDRYQMQATDTPRDCANAALDGSDPRSTTVLAVADAEHAPSVSGGFAEPGSACTDITCSAAQTRRWVYVGASDFHPDWGTTPPLDLVEHEVGHTLGWPHSGDVPDDPYASGLDVMSKAAAPRDFDPAARDGQGTLAVNLWAAGWIPSSDVLVASRSGRFRLVPSSAASGPRMLIMPIDDRRFLAAEYLTPDGLDRHLPQSGVTITLVDLSPTGCGVGAGRPCKADQRVQRTLVGSAPFYDTLTNDSGEWSAFGWDVRVGSIPNGMLVDVCGDVAAVGNTRLVSRCGDGSS